MNDKLALRDPIIDIDGDPRDDKIDALERQVAKLRGELSDTRHELQRVKEDSNRALTGVRQQLSPLYRALQRLFGELDDAGVADVPLGAPTPASTPPVNSRATAVWESWKSKLGTGPARIIDALLLHGEMTAKQLKIACACRQNSIYEWMVKLNKAGIVNKNGGRFSLKEL